MVRLKDIAKKCNVSIATVSKALNHSSEISEKRTKEIIKTANQMGYIANSTARSLKTKRSHNIGLLYVDSTSSGLEHEYFSRILNAIKDKAESLGYDVTFISNKVGKSRRSYLTHARYRNFDGILIVSADFKDSEVIELVEANIPSITIDHQFHNKTAIMSDNIDGLNQIVKHVYDKGHRKIAYIHGEDTTVTKQRLASFYKTCAELGIKVPTEYVKKALYHIPKNSGIATRELLKLDEPPTCIIFPDDYSYMGGLTEIEKHGLKVPDDISAVGFDGIYLSKILRPRLTTYEQDSKHIGEKAISELIEYIEKPQTYIAQQIIIKGRLQKGQTVKEI